MKRGRQRMGKRPPAVATDAQMAMSPEIHGQSKAMTLEDRGGHEEKEVKRVDHGRHSAGRP